MFYVFTINGLQCMKLFFVQYKGENRNNMRALRAKLKGDARFTVNHGDPSRKTDAELIATATDSLQQLVSSVKERRVLAGEPKDYEKLHNYLKIIAKAVLDEPDDVTRTDRLFRLAVEGGEYCGPGKYEVVESVFAETVAKNPEIPLEDKVLYCLQDERNLWMQGFFNHSILRHPVGVFMGKVIDLHDVHSYNYFLNLYGDEFGLRKAGADNDDAAIIGLLYKLFISHTIGKFIKAAFWEDHRVDTLTETVVDAIGTFKQGKMKTAKVPRDKIYTFWQEWIQRQPITGLEKEHLLEELGQGKLYGRWLEYDNGTMDSSFVQAMLYDMGIAELGEEPVLQGFVHEGVSMLFSRQAWRMSDAGSAV